MLRTTGIVPDTALWYGPGSAAHQAVKNGPLRCVRGTCELIRHAALFALRFRRRDPPREILGEAREGVRQRLAALALWLAVRPKRLRDGADRKRRRDHHHAHLA